MARSLGKLDVREHSTCSCELRVWSNGLGVSCHQNNGGEIRHVTIGALIVKKSGASVWGHVCEFKAPI